MKGNKAMLGSLIIILGILFTLIIILIILVCIPYFVLMLADWVNESSFF